jgi:hypothetical protein
MPAAVFLSERQPEQVMRGEQLADIPRILTRGVDLGGAGRHLLGDDLTNGVAELAQLVGNGIDARGVDGAGHQNTGVSV